MRIVSLVPSWTETLLKAGVEVVGRTRFCIHPAQKITNIPVVGGTKEVDWDLIIDLNPDLIIMDKEENPLAIAEECPLPYLATHVYSLQSMQKELERLGKKFENQQLLRWAYETEEILQLPRRSWNYQKIPGLIETIRTTDNDSAPIVYMIWKKPWMCVSRETYIGSVIEYLGGRVFQFEHDEKYPLIELEDIQDCYVLFSSEPFPFHKRIQELRELNLAGAVVDGESYSWFGLRSLEFLKSISTL